MDVSGELVDPPLELLTCKQGDRIIITWREEGSEKTCTSEFMVDQRYDYKPGYIIYGDIRLLTGQKRTTIYLRQDSSLVIIDP